jgi:chitinase
MKKTILSSCVFLMISIVASAQPKNKLAVIAYYNGSDRSQIDSFSVDKLTHIIFSFCHLKGSRLHVDNASDTSIIRKLAGLKKRNPDLKVLLSLGGWGGCETCSNVFSTDENRKAFALSVKELSEYFHTDGIDLDWEYPTIEGYPGHLYQPADKKNFTSLVRQLRETLGTQYQISFAAGGFSKYISEAVEWDQLVSQVNYINVMTYDLVNGSSPVTGHHTPLYSTGQQKESVDNAVQQLMAQGVPLNKIVIGAAFYGRVWQDVPDSNGGLYQPGKFLKSVSYKSFAGQFSADDGFIYHWDETAMAPYLYNASRHWFVTYDDPRSIALKTKYALDRKLGGIMFWQLTSDDYSGGLLDAIDKARISNTKQ